MSEKVTDADMTRFHELMKRLAGRAKWGSLFLLQPEDVNPTLAAHRIAAAKAERERCVAKIREYAGIANERYVFDDLTRLCDELAKEE